MTETLTKKLNTANMRHHATLTGNNKEIYRVTYTAGSSNKSWNMEAKLFLSKFENFETIIKPLYQDQT
jgi:hypothetical protein